MTGEALRAIQALQGHRCERCHTLLSRGQKECCNRAYCPWCRKPDTPGCEHIVARGGWNLWTMPGVLTPGVGSTCDPTLELCLEERSEDEQCGALEYAYDAAMKVLHAGQSGLPAFPHCVIARLIEASGLTASARCRGPVPHRPGRVLFSHEPEAFREQVVHLVGDWMRGFQRMREMPAESARRLARCFTGPATPVRFVIVSPCGMHVAVVGGDVLEVRSTVDGSLCVRETLPWVRSLRAPFPDRRTLLSAATVAAGCDVICHGSGLDARPRRARVRRYDWKGTPLTRAWDLVADLDIPLERPENVHDIRLLDADHPSRRLVLRPRAGVSSD